MSNFKIIGNSSPVVGEEQTYSIAEGFKVNFVPGTTLNNSEVFSHDVHWSIYQLKGKKWLHRPKNDKVGPTAKFNFFEATIDYEGIRLVAKLGNEEAVMDIRTQKGIDRKIVQVDFLDANWNKPQKAFAYGDKMIVRINCVNLDKCHGSVTLWEDDTPKSGQNDMNKNNKATTLPIYIEDGKAEAHFILTPDLAKKANAQADKGKSNEGEFHEYYVTVEVFNQKTFESQDVDVINPDYKKEQTPAEKKGPSKKEEKGIKANDKVHDYLETKVDVLAEIRKIGDMVRETLNKALTVDVPDETEETSDTCVCKENNFYWSNKLTCDERKKVLEVCAKLWGEDQKKDKASELMAIMHLETGNINSFKPYADNGADYSGLIQFSDASAKKLGTTRSALKKMTFIEQMNYVHDYFASKKDISNMVDLYLHVLKPNAVGNGNNPDYVLFDESISVPDGDGSQTSPEQRKINIGREPWVTKYGYSSNPSFMKDEEHTRRRKWVYTKQRFEDRWGFINGKTTVADVILELNQAHYNPGANELFIGKCENIEEEKIEKIDGERAPWMKVAWEEYEKYKGIKEEDSPLKEKIKDYFKETGYNSGYKDAWCASFVNWCFKKTMLYKDTNSKGAMAARDWGPAGNSYLAGSAKDGWLNGEITEAFLGAVAVIKSHSHVVFIIGVNSKGDFVNLGGNQGSKVAGSQKICMGSMPKSDVLYIMKPKNYQVLEEEKKLPIYDIDEINDSKSTR